MNRPRRAPRCSPAAAALCAWLCCATVAAEAGEGALAPADPVQVAAEQCDPAFVEQITALLRVELSTRSASEGAPAPSEVHVALQCLDAELAIEAEHAAGPTRGERVQLAQTPAPLRPRVTALRIAEIVRALDQAAAPREPAAALRPAPAAPQREPSRSTPPAVQRDLFAAPLELAVLLQASSFHGDDTWLFGPSLAADYRVARFMLGGEAGFAQRRADTALGQIAVYAGHVSPHAAWSFGAGPWQARLGAGCAFGLTQVSARAQTPAVVGRGLTALWLAPHALAVLGLALTPATRLQLRAAAGWVAVPVIAEVQRADDIAQRGLWTQLQLGAALAL